MNFRSSRSKPDVFVFQIAPMVDILLVPLVFFIVTWNFALSENSLDVKIPTANEAKANQAYVGQVVVNVRSNGSLVFNKNPISGEELLQKLNKLSKLFPDQAVIIRGDRRADYQHIVDVLDICRKANIWNIAFATVKQE